MSPIHADAQDLLTDPLHGNHILAYNLFGQNLLLTGKNKQPVT